MINLMKLEIKRNKIRTFMIASAVIFIFMLGFIYLFAYAPQLEPDDQDMKLFAGYNNIITLFSVVTMFSFCVLSAVMYSRFIIEEYTGKRIILLFSYPVGRGKIFISKIALVSLFTILSMIICNIIVLSIFGISETIFPLVTESITSGIIIKAIKTTFILAITAAGLGIISMGIGFINKSVPATIISAVILCSLLSNLVAGTLESDTPIFTFTALTILAGIIVITILIQKINKMEAE